MMSKQKILTLGLYGLAFFVVVTYVIGCFEPDNLRIKMNLLSPSASDEQAQRHLNYFRSSQWKTDKELAGESAPKHTHGIFCTVWLITAIILPISAVGHSMIMLACRMSRIKKRVLEILAQKQRHESKDTSNKSTSTIGSFLNRPVRVKDEVAGGLIFLLLHKAVRLYRQRIKRSK